MEKYGFSIRAGLWMLFFFVLYLHPISVPAQRYERLWREVARAQQQSLPRSALSTIEKIREKAVAEGNSCQEMAAILAAGTLRQQITPDSFYQDFPRLEQRIARTGDSVERALLASYAAEICQNQQFRGQWKDAETTDSLPLPYWSRKDYQNRALYYYNLSMADPAVLTTAVMRDYEPLLQRGDEDRIFKNDLLHVLGRRALNGLDALGASQQEKIEMAHRILTVYRQQENREAELMFLLDSIRLSSRTYIGYREINRDSLLRHTPEYRAYADLMTRFADIPSVAEAYLRAAQMDFSDSVRVRLLEEGVSRYPRYNRKEALENELRFLRQPFLNWSAPECAVPGDTLSWCLQYRNLKHAEYQVYEIPATLRDTLHLMGAEDARKLLRRYGRLVEKRELSLQKVRSPYETVCDTLPWPVPRVGHYALCFEARSPEGKQYSIACLQTSGLRLISLPEPEGRMLDVVVVEARSGRPVPGAWVEARSLPSSRSPQKQTAYTDADGRALLDLSALDHYSLRAACPGDTVTLQSAGKGFYRSASLPSGCTYIYTDRAVYRPGQQVHLAGLVCRLQDGAYAAVPDTVLPLTITDVSGKIVFRDTLTTDVWGGWQTVYMLPQEGTNGRYRVSAGGSQRSFRMEEYVRPHFELTLDPDNRNLVAWGDSLKVAGAVTNYNGTPAAQARVVARCEIYSNYFQWENEKTVRTDTLQTDAEGRFTFAFAVGENPHPEQQTYPYQVRVEVTALHPSGEMADQRLFAQVVPLKNELAVTVPSIIDTDEGATLQFGLENTLRDKITGTVFYSLTPQAARASVPPAATSGKFIANKSFRWENLRGIPSGRYMLNAWACVQGDTLKVRRPLILYSGRDTRVPVDTTFWFRILQPEFSEKESFACQIGSSCPDVTLYYTLCYDGKIQERKVLAFSDSLFVLKLPYRPEYGEGASLHLAFVKNNQVYSRSVRIEHRLPEARLHYRWQTFRNLLEPGARENWTLQLTDTAGQPVQARALFTLYDASLDAISRHNWSFSLPRVSGFYVPNWNSRYLSVASFYMPFAIESKPLKNEVLSDINRMLIDGGGISTVGNLVKNAMPGVYAAAPQAARMAKTQSAADMVLEEKVVSTSTELGAGQPETSEIPETSVRRNLQETAFFQPALVTDEAGCIRLSFVVPEALTRWRLLGLAYTRDLAYCRIDTTVVTQRKLMAQLFQPTYLNVGDRAVLKVTVNNLDSLADRGRLLLEITDAATGTLLSKQTQAFSVAARGSAQYAFEFMPEAGDRTLICRILAEGQTATDGEQQQLYVLPPTIPVTYARPFVVEGAGSHQVALPSMAVYTRQGIYPSSWFLEYHTDPLFAAFQVLPLLQKAEGKSAQDLAASYYAAVCSAHLWHTTPQVARWMKTWSDPQYLLQEDEWWKWVRRLNPRLWEATPWSRQKDEADNRFAGMYADSINERSQLETRREILSRLAESQRPDGSFAWMPGMNGTVAVTRQVLALLESVRPYTAGPADAEIQQTERRLADRAFEYLKRRFLSQTPVGKQITPAADRTFLWLAATHLGAEEALKIPSVKESVDALRKNYATMPYASKPEAARVLLAYGHRQEARECLRSVQEHLVTDSLGACFLETVDGGGSAGELRLLQHLSVMELFQALMPEQTALYQGMQRWVLLQKRIQGWDNDYLSACAVGTLLQGLDRPEKDGQADTLLLRTSATGQETRIPAVTDGLPVVRYLQPVGSGKAQPDVLTVKKHDDRMTWGTAYTQYDLSPEQIAQEQKEWGALSVEIHDLPDTLQVGEEMKAVYLIRSDRDYDYMLLHLRSAACCRPAWLTSGYRSVQGVRYYLSLEDDGMLLYFEHLPKGNYVLEVPYHTQFRGTYLHGGAEIQSYYAPEFRRVFPGKKIKVDEKE